MKRLPRVAIELKSDKDVETAQSFKLQCLKRGKQMREVLLSMMTTYSKEASK